MQIFNILRGNKQNRVKNKKHKCYLVNSFFFSFYILYQNILKQTFPFSQNKSCHRCCKIERNIEVKIFSIVFVFFSLP